MWSKLIHSISHLPLFLLSHSSFSLFLPPSFLPSFPFLPFPSLYSFLNLSDTDALTQVQSSDNIHSFDDDTGLRSRRRSVSDPKQTLMAVNVRYIISVIIIVLTLISISWLRKKRRLYKKRNTCKRRRNQCKWYNVYCTCTCIFFSFFFL